ncbi:MAG: hypothetical protein JW908_15090 [Anaerolineales bacterium]|nr:hypothetical protein [Anaerolineales bacterium]
MSQKKHVYQWSKKDRLLHLISAAPLITFYIGSIYLLARESIYLAGIFLLLWVGVNLCVASICAGCPYRGGYCPGVCQLYFAPFLSMLMYKDTEKRLSHWSFKVNLALLGIFGIGSYVFAFYWLFRLHWQEHPLVVLGLLVLLLLHMPLSFFMLCPKCGYNNICPMANVHRVFKKDSDFDGGGDASSD